MHTTILTASRRLTRSDLESGAPSAPCEGGKRMSMVVYAPGLISEVYER